MRRGYLINVGVLLLMIPLLLLAATYQQTYAYISHSQNQRTLVERQYFSVTNIQNDLQNFIDLSFRRAYLALTEYVIDNTFVPNASKAFIDLMKYGELNGLRMNSMDGLTMEYWFNNLTSYLERVGLRIQPANSKEFLKNHVEMTVAPLDSFHVAVRVRLVNITIVDSSGVVRYSGDVPSDGYIYSIVSVVGFEDPFIVRELNGLYTRVITPCRIPFPGKTYGYYNPNSSDDVGELVLNWCYVGLPDNGSMRYPTILERFEGNMDHHTYYLKLAYEFQRDLNYTVKLPVGLETFLVPGITTDPTLIGALTSMGASVPTDYTSVSYYFLKCAVEHLSNYCKTSVWTGSKFNYPTFKLDETTKKLLFGN